MHTNSLTPAAASVLFAASGSYLGYETALSYGARNWGMRECATVAYLPYSACTSSSTSIAWQMARRSSGVDSFLLAVLKTM